jgi:bifunctional UDP-N-acetylglucosamine pyrophosphorylase/glucosamine-1-phosphate N-acetyltransferase
MINDLSIIILAAGKGTRMKSSLPKVMHSVALRPMLYLVIDQAIQLSPKSITIVISEHLKSWQQQISADFPAISIDFAIQQQQLGTADAVKSALPSINKYNPAKVLILYADTPLINSKTLKQMLDLQCCIAVLSFQQNLPHQYGRLISNEQNQVFQIIEHKDCDNKQLQITLCNSGVMAISGNHLEMLLNKINNNNKAQEYYLTDIISLANSSNLACLHLPVSKNEVLGVNSKQELVFIDNIKQQQIKQQLLDDGITIIMPDTVYIAHDANIEADVIIDPFVFIGKNVVIKAGSHIKSFSHLEGVVVGNNASIGPYSRLRPGTIVADDAKIGNFVEVKNSKVGKNSKINHLSYIGDATVGDSSNIGAGTITCNYDGYQKFNTTIGDDVFIGSNSCLIAPLNIGNNVVVGAGSVITNNIDNGDMAVCRAKQTNIKQGAVRYHNRKSNA